MLFTPALLNDLRIAVDRALLPSIKKNLSASAKLVTLMELRIALAGVDEKSVYRN